MGCSGITTNVTESEINLSICKKLKKYLENQGLRVVLTRTNDQGLYDDNVANYKLSDMNNRLKIIKQSNADLLISIHQNSFSDSSLKGAQVFYQEGDDKGAQFAHSMQEQLKSTLDYTRGNYNHSDLYILKESGVLGILIECGYLTNIEDEINLQNSEYQDKMAYAIMCGVMRYMLNTNNVADVW